MKAWLDSEYLQQIQLLEALVNTASGSLDAENLESFAEKLAQILEPFATNLKRHRNASGKLIALSFSKGLEKKRSLFLNIHFDTVFDKDSEFKVFERLSDEYATGPGVIDAKGGLVILLSLLKAFQGLAGFEDIGYTVVLNCDEELGSPDSSALLEKMAKGHDLGLVFEPSLENRNMILARPATAFVEITATGKAAHAGRGYLQGENAIQSLLAFIHCLKIGTFENKNCIANLGVITGGQRANIVPDFAKAQLNIRAFHQRDLDKILADWQDLVNQQDNIALKVLTKRVARPNTAANQAVFDCLAESIQALGLDIQFENSFGVCDGNSIAAAGLPVIDTFGAEGTGMHTVSETIYLPSLKMKTALALHFIQAYFNK